MLTQSTQKNGICCPFKILAYSPERCPIMHIDNDPLKEEADLLSYTRRIYHDFYVQNDIALLLASLAPDVSWCGGGSQMMRSGRDEVMRFFVSTKDEMIPFTIHNETTAVHRLSADFINITIANDVQTLPSTPLLLKEHLKCDILYRKNPDCANGIGWEIVHINNSVSYDKLNPDETYPIAEGTRAYQQLTETPVLPENKISFFRMIGRKLMPSLSTEEQHCLSILSIFDNFSVEDATTVCGNTDIYALLNKLLAQGFVLQQTKTTGTYALYPLIREFLQQKFSLLPKEEQNQHLTCAAQHFLSQQQYTKAMSYANRAKNYFLCLRIFIRGADTILLSSPKTYPMDLLDYVPSSVLKKHMYPVLYILLDMYFTNARNLYQKNYDRVNSLLTGEDKHIFFELLKAYISLNNLPSMINHMQNACTILQHTHFRQKLYAPPLGFLCPSFALIYHSVPGKFSEEINQLATLHQLSATINHKQNQEEWALYFKAEYSYHTGNWKKSAEILAHLSTLPAFALELPLRARILYIQGFMAYFQNDSSSLSDIYEKLQSLLPRATSYESMLIHLCSLRLRSAIPCIAEKNISPDSEPESPLRHSPGLTYQELIETCTLIKPGNGIPLLYAALRNERFSRERHSVLGEIYSYLYQAIAYDMLNQPDDFRQSLTKALTLAAPDHIISPFLPFTSHLPVTWSQIRGSDSMNHLIQDIALFVQERPYHLEVKSMQCPLLQKTLTGKELRIIHLAVSGKTNREIAEELHLAEITIKKALSRIYKKLGIKNRTQLATLINQHFLNP